MCQKKSKNHGPSWRSRSRSGVSKGAGFFAAAALDGGKTKQLLPENDGFQEELPFLGTSLSSFQVPC